MLFRSVFFLEVCDYYGVQSYNLTPNNVLYIAGFQALFEGWLRLAPRINFFRYVFHIRKQTIGKKGNKQLAVCGLVSINLRRYREWYPKVPKINSVKDWIGTFFYCKDVPLPGKPSGKDAKGPFILGRPFMETSRTKIDCFEGLITMEYNGDI